MTKPADRRYIPTTPRADLKSRSSVNLHSSWAEAPWNSRGTDLAAAVVALGVGMVRDALNPHDATQRTFHQTLADAGVRLHLNVIEDRTDVDGDVAYLASLPYAAAVAHLAGPNEPNSSGSDSWPGRLLTAMQRLKAARDAHMPDVAVTGMGLKHEHVKDYDGDLVLARPAAVYVDAGWLAFHYYPGIGGPSSNAAERDRAQAGYGATVGIHEETGIESTQMKDPAARAAFCVETLLRNYLSGIALTNLYELADDSTGNFGIMGTPAADAVAVLLATADGPDPFPGWLSVDSPDASCVVTAEASGWTVYLMGPAIVEIVLPPGHDITGQTHNVGPLGNLHFQITTVDSMTVLAVTA